ncbi:uncharacterized protein UTRI_110689 [Ustilago trichophora]|uniref:Stress response protein NST1 n=1 Tax=Ustilago trichophora TaxID=86804 RepID=A0A5C3E9E9_9BASI|nr:uncharacterized protein UTRI_110689 [Ustilago trichophora]
MAKSKLPRSTPAARGAAVAPPKLANAAQHQHPSQPSTPAPMQHPKQPVAGASTLPRSVSPVSNHNADTAALSSAKKKKKKSKSKAKDSDFIDDHEYDLQSAAALGQRPRSPASLAARAQAQAQLLAAASELYRRIEGDAQEIPDDDAYWTSLPAHLRTFIRNALPLGQFPPAAQAALNDNANDPANRHASTQAMIAVAQQLEQAAHASQRHLQQYPPGTHPYPPLPFDASIFANLALHPDQALPLHPHPNAANSAHLGSTNGSYAQYASSTNPPPTQPPVEPLPPPVVLYDNFDDEIDRFDDNGDDGAQYYDDGELEEDDKVLDAQGGLLRARERVWMQDGADHAHRANGMGVHPDELRSASKNKKKKKKKKKGGAGARNGHGDDEAHEIEVEVPPPPKPVPNHPPPSTNVSSVARNSNPPPPSSRAAGKQPMTFNSTGKTPARPANGVPPLSNSGKRSVSSSTHGQQPAANPPTNNAKIWLTSSAEERERIKEFWLGLSMKDRQKLVQVEKETILKKMKEQQKFLCSCAVCSRKRSAIEEELEVLCDAYYDELEEYANHQQRWASSGGTIPPPPGPGPFPGSVALDASGAVIGGDPLSCTRAEQCSFLRKVRIRWPKLSFRTKGFCAPTLVLCTTLLITSLITSYNIICPEYRSAHYGQHAHRSTHSARSTPAPTHIGQLVSVLRTLDQLIPRIMAHTEDVILGNRIGKEGLEYKVLLGQADTAVWLPVVTLRQLGLSKKLDQFSQQQFCTMKPQPCLPIKRLSLGDLFCTPTEIPAQFWKEIKRTRPLTPVVLPLLAPPSSPIHTPPIHTPPIHTPPIHTPPIHTPPIHTPNPSLLTLRSPSPMQLDDHPPPPALPQSPVVVSESADSPSQSSIVYSPSFPISSTQRIKKRSYRCVSESPVDEPSSKRHASHQSTLSAQHEPDTAARSTKVDQATQTDFELAESHIKHQTCGPASVFAIEFDSTSASRFFGKQTVRLS